MKKILINCIILLLIIIMLSACSDNNKAGITDIQTNQMTPEGLDKTWLASLNRDLGTGYKSFEQALNEQTAIYEAEENNENLYKVCRVLLEMPRVDYYDMIIKYYGKLLDTMAKDKEFNEYINNNWPNLFKGFNMYSLMQDYLCSLYESNMEDRFRYVVNNLELYIANPIDIIKTAASAVNEIENEQGPQEDFRLLKEVLLQCEQKYADKVDTINQAVITASLAKCADRLGETELAEKYRQKRDDLLEAITEAN